MVQVFNWSTVGGDLFEPLEDRLEGTDRSHIDGSIPIHPYDWKYRHPRQEWIPQYRRDGSKYYVPLHE